MGIFSSPKQKFSFNLAERFLFGEIRVRFPSALCVPPAKSLAALIFPPVYGNAFFSLRRRPLPLIFENSCSPFFSRTPLVIPFFSRVSAHRGPPPSSFHHFFFSPRTMSPLFSTEQANPFFFFPPRIPSFETECD